MSTLDDVGVQEKFPFDWKGKGNEESIEIDNSEDEEVPIDNSEDGEVPMDISCSEEGQTPPSIKRTSGLIQKTTPALTEHPPKYPVAKAMQVAMKGPPVVETGKVDTKGRNTLKTVENPPQINKPSRSNPDGPSKKRHEGNSNNTGQRSSDKQLGGPSKHVKTTDQELRMAPTNLIPEKKLGNPSKAVTKKNAEQRRAPSDLSSEKKLGGPSKSVKTKNAEQREEPSHLVKAQVSSSKRNPPTQKRSQSVAAKDFSDYLPREEDLKGWSEVTLDKQFGKSVSSMNFHGHYIRSAEY